MENFWNRGRRILQTNLQVQDTALIQPERLAAQMEELGTEVLVFNVGGIYAWYQSRIPYHHVNEYLDPDTDLLGDVIRACHARGIRVVGRFDFSRAEDRVYQAHPEWFAQDAQGRPLVVGSMRPGEWSLLYTVCMSSGYWREDMAAPVLREALERYPLDGVFFNGVYPPDCRCDICRERYRRMYGTEMPEAAEDLDPSWRSRQIEENIAYLREEIRKIRPEIPVIVYHWPEQSRYLSAPMEDLICDESQNVLSRGIQNLSPDWLPSYKMKLCALDSPKAPPCGIIHSSPGMDWRHTGLPPAEYRFWMSQVYAAGGSLWHSLTGVPDTISDKRLLDEVRGVNRDIKASEQKMDGMRPSEELAMLFDAERPPEGWLSVLYGLQIQFSLIHAHSPEGLEDHTAILVPHGVQVSAELAQRLCRYVRSGGRLLWEGKLPEHTPELAELCGIRPFQKVTEYYYSSYLAPSEAWDRRDGVGLDRTPLLAFRGRVARSHCTDGRILASLVPTFAPLDAVGAPPERASILTKQTDIPLCVERDAGQGYVLLLTFSLAHLIEEFSLGEHYQLAEALLSRLVPDRAVRITTCPGLIVHEYHGKNGLLLHFVNGAGKRPLRTALPVHIKADIRIPEGKRVYRAVEEITRQEISFVQEDGRAVFELSVPEAMRAVFLSFAEADE